MILYSKAFRTSEYWYATVRTGTSLGVPLLTYGQIQFEETSRLRAVPVRILRTGEYRYPSSSTGTHSCKSAINVGLKLSNDTIDDLTYQNGWKSISRYKNKILKLQQQVENNPRAKIQS
ncbi:hypothetical protein V6N13_045417 [Hibiscus sabdariffa]